jgi:pimeloyl-ACP methyl ester carboxylesterase
MTLDNHLFQPPGFNRLSLSTSSGTINYYEANPTLTETIVFLHGFGGGSSSYEWSKVYPAFSAEYRVLAPDLPGWGFSEHRTGEYTAQDYQLAIREFIRATCQRPVIVVASSVVATFCVTVANQQPQLFERLIFMNPSGLKDFGQSYNGSFFSFASQVPFVNDFLYSQVITTRSSIRKFLEERLFVRANRISDEIVEAYFVSAQQKDGKEAAYSFLKGNFTADLAECLPGLKVPTAILWGAKNTYSEPAVGERLSRLSEMIYSFEVIADVGLTPQLELPGVTVAAVRRAMEKSPTSSATSSTGFRDDYAPQ